MISFFVVLLIEFFRFLLTQKIKKGVFLFIECFIAIYKNYRIIGI